MPTLATARRYWALLAGVAAFGAPGPAQAADGYIVDFCKNWDTDAPGKVFPGLAGFGTSGEVADCHLGGAAGGIHQMQLGGRMSYDTVAGIRLSVPADRPGISIDRVLSADSMQSNSGSIAFLRFAAGGALLDDNPGPQVRRDDRSLPAGSRTLEWSIYCSYSAGATPCQWPAADDVFHLYKVRLFLSEAQVPSLSITGGTLLGNHKQSGVRTITFDSADADSGVASATVMLGEVATAIAQYPCPSSDWSACQRTRASQSLSVDTTQVPDGTYDVTVHVRDAAGNAATRSAGEVSIANGHSEGAQPSRAPDAGSVPVPPIISVGSPNGVRASRVATLKAAYTGSHAGERTARVRYESAPTVRGRLVDEHRQPIVGATLSVLSRHRRAGAATAQIATVRTDGGGSFRYRLPPGPSRTVTFAYTAFGGDKRTAQATVTTAVRASVAAARFVPRSPRPGERVSFTGRLRYLPWGGVQIAVQFRDGRRWRTIGLTRTRAGGRFTWFYRFIRSRPGDVFEFRAHVSSPIYPFAAGDSRAVRVQLSG